MKQEISCDTVIIGAGPAGYVAGIRLAQLGQKVTLVEEARVGGVCLNRGCIPVKALLYAAAVLRNAAEARTLGIRFSSPEIDLISLGAWRSRIVDRLARGIEFLLKSNGVELVRGRAEVLAPDRVAVNGPDRALHLTARNLIIATGSEPAELPGLKPDQKQIIDSNGALNLVELPKTLVIVGAGAVGLEFATIFARLGTEVTVLEMCDTILPGIDPDLTLLVRSALEREGVRFVLGVKGLACTPGAPAVRVCTAQQEWVAEKILIAAGRRPRTGGLGLEALPLELDARGFIKTDSGYQTSVPGVYAIGDVRGGPLLAHKAMYEGVDLAVTLARGGKPLPGERKAIPTVVYTDPEIAAVGLSEDAARARGLRVRVAQVPASAIGRSLVLGRGAGVCKLVAEEDTGRILGGGIVAPQADALITEIACAVELGLTAEQLGRVVHPHPTMSELVLETAHALSGSAIHIVNR